MQHILYSRLAHLFSDASNAFRCIQSLPVYIRFMLVLVLVFLVYSCVTLLTHFRV